MAPVESAEPHEGTIGRRFLSLLYEALLLVGVLWCATVPYQLVEQGLGYAHSRPLFQAYLVAAAGVYFTWQWVRGGQTLPMKTWRLRVTAHDGGPVTPRQGALRYVAALGFFGFTFVWAFFDRDRRFLHDRLARTRVVRI